LSGWLLFFLFVALTSTPGRLDKDGSRSWHALAWVGWASVVAALLAASLRTGGFL
jgi:hypothetical protein